MRSTIIALLCAGWMLGGGLTANAQEMHGFELRDGAYFWTGRFVSEGMGAEELQNVLLDNLSSNPHITNVRATNDGRLVGSVRDLPEAIRSTGMFVFSFGFAVDISDGEYSVTTREWVGKSTNPAMSGGVMRIEQLLTGMLIGNKRRENFFKAHEAAQVKIFRLE